MGGVVVVFASRSWPSTERIALFPIAGYEAASGGLLVAEEALQLTLL